VSSVRAIPWKARAVIGGGCLVVAIAVGAFAAATGRASSTVAPPVDHQLCYAASGAFTKVPAGVRLIDSFNPNGFVPHISGKAGVLCNPVTKTLPTGKVYGITHPAAHLACFPITAQTTQPTPRVVVTNQFGQATLAPASRPNLLCVPSWKSLTGALHKSVSTPPGLSHFTCYPVSVVGGAFNPPSGIKLRDEFSSAKVATQVNPVPKELCLPAQKVVGSRTYPIVNPVPHLLCFGVSKTPIRNPVWAQNQFGSAKLAVRATQWLCPPSTMQDAPPTVISTSPSNGTTGVFTGSTITINFSEPVLAGAGAFSLECPMGTSKTFALSSSPASSFTLTPTSSLPKSTACRVTVHASGIKDVDAGSPLGADYVFSFTTSAGNVYYLTYDSVKRVPLGGGTPTTLLGGQLYLAWAAKDSTHLYWANYGAAGTVNKLPFGGGSVTTIVSGVQNPYGLAVDGTSVYWTSYSDGTVNKAPLGGGSATTLASGQNSPVNLTVDGTNVYWVTAGDPGLNNGTVNEVPIGGGSVTTLASGQDGPESVAVDGTNVYWVNHGTNIFGGGSVNQVPIAGGSATTLVTGLSQPLSLAVDGTYVYFEDAGTAPPGSGTVNKVPIGGGSVITLASGQGDSRSLTVDGTYVYWVDFSAGTVNKVPLGGGGVITLASGEDEPNSLVLGP
jgi:hypothetical protein